MTSPIAATLAAKREVSVKVRVAVKAAVQATTLSSRAPRVIRRNDDGRCGSLGSTDRCQILLSLR
jgi:hypothetical protein